MRKEHWTRKRESGPAGAHGPSFPSSFPSPNTKRRDSQEMTEETGHALGSPTSPWKQSGSQVRVPGMAGCSPLITSIYPSTLRALLRAGQEESLGEHTPRSHPCLFSRSQGAGLKGKGVVLVTEQRRSSRRLNAMPYNWNDVSSRNVTMLTFHSVAWCKRCPCL